MNSGTIEQTLVEQAIAAGDEVAETPEGEALCLDCGEAYLDENGDCAECDEPCRERCMACPGRLDDFGACLRCGYQN